uniref:Putative secreted protein n=1 Tax=Anopheles darlingi TaxID=43151 RepID=A0A2M4DF56_ANODA
MPLLLPFNCGASTPLVGEKRLITLYFSFLLISPALESFLPPNSFFSCPEVLFSLVRSNPLPPPTVPPVLPNCCCCCCCWCCAPSVNP